MESVLNMATQRAREAGAARIHVIHLRIGELSGVVPEALQFAFETLSPGTAAEHAKLGIERVPARFWCGQCRRDFEATDLLADCPECGTPSAELKAGREMELTSLEIE